MPKQEPAKKQDAFTAAAATVRGQGRKIMDNVSNLATRKSAVARVITVVGLGAAAGMVGLGEYSEKAPKPAVQMKDHAWMATILALVAVGLYALTRNMSTMKDEWGPIEDMLKKSNLPANVGVKEAEMIFGLVANYMTDAEYGKMTAIINEWTASKAPFSFNAADAQTKHYIDQISPIVMRVIDRTMGLRDTLTHIATGNGTIVDLTFQSAANNLYSQGKIKTGR